MGILFFALLVGLLCFFGKVFWLHADLNFSFYINCKIILYIYIQLNFIIWNIYTVFYIKYLHCILLNIYTGFCKLYDNIILLIKLKPISWKYIELLKIYHSNAFDGLMSYIKKFNIYRYKMLSSSCLRKNWLLMASSIIKVRLFKFF
jgi:hypothetical protein